VRKLELIVFIVLLFVAGSAKAGTFVVGTSARKTIVAPSTQKEVQAWRVFLAKNFGRVNGADFNNDGIVNMRDFAVFANHWLEVQ
jgi:hypothetical protein